MSKEITDLHPILQTKCREVLLKAKLQNIDVRITHTFRRPEEQDAIYAQGRTVPGKIVTSLTGAKSKHCRKQNGQPAAEAFDFGIFINGKYITDGNHPSYKIVGEIGEALGLTWGGRWKKPFDPGHLELK